MSVATYFLNWSVVERLVRSAIDPTATSATTLMVSSRRTRKLLNIGSNLGLGLSELIAEAVHGQHVFRLRRVRLYLLPQVHHMDIERALEAFIIVPEHLLKQLQPRESPSRIPRHGG